MPSIIVTYIVLLLLFSTVNSLYNFTFFKTSIIVYTHHSFTFSRWTKTYPLRINNCMVVTLIFNFYININIYTPKKFPSQPTLLSRKIKVFLCTLFRFLYIFLSTMDVWVVLVLYIFLFIIEIQMVYRQNLLIRYLTRQEAKIILFNNRQIKTQSPNLDIES